MELAKYVTDSRKRLVRMHPSGADNYVPGAHYMDQIEQLTHQCFICGLDEQLEREMAAVNASIAYATASNGRKLSKGSLMSAFASASMSPSSAPSPIATSEAATPSQGQAVSSNTTFTPKTTLVNRTSGVISSASPSSTKAGAKTQTFVDVTKLQPEAVASSMHGRASFISTLTKLNEELDKELEYARTTGSADDYVFPFEPPMKPLVISLPQDRGINTKQAEESPEDNAKASNLSLIFRLAEADTKRPYTGLQYIYGCGDSRPEPAEKPAVPTMNEDLDRVPPPDFPSFKNCMFDPYSGRLVRKSEQSGLDEGLEKWREHPSLSLNAPRHSKEGCRVPWSTFSLVDEKGRRKEVSTTQLFDGCKAVVFSAPGAFTPTASHIHIPRYNDLMQCFRLAGVTHVFCVSVNDALVLREWQRQLGTSATNIHFLPDAAAEFTMNMGMLVRSPGEGFKPVSWRYSMFVDHGVIIKQFIEPNAGDETLECTTADKLLFQINPRISVPNFVTVFTRENCKDSIRLRDLLEARRVPFTENVIGQHITREAFLGIGGGTTGTPLTFVDGKKIGGFEETAKFFRDGGLTGAMVAKPLEAEEDIAVD